MILKWGGGVDTPLRTMVLCFIQYNLVRLLENEKPNFHGWYSGIYFFDTMLQKKAKLFFSKSQIILQRIMASQRTLPKSRSYISNIISTKESFLSHCF